MYITKIRLENIKAISHLEMQFEKPAGWHVLIGDNGSGKSSVLRAIALGLIGTDYKALPIENLSQWIKTKQPESKIEINYIKNDSDGYSGKGSLGKENQFHLCIQIKKNENGIYSVVEDATHQKEKTSPKNLIWSNKKGWFSASFGAFRRFTGGNKELEKIYLKDPRAAAHLSLFGEDVALTEILDWLKNLNYQVLEGNEEAKYLMDNVKTFFNHSGLLPHDTKLDKISSEGVFFTDGNGTEINVEELSDGFRSILSLTFELIRQLIRVFGAKEIFKNFSKKNYFFDLQGVVLIDEIDVHLHPTWQTRIGEWFTQYFPAMQFIVATHSPLICRACEKSSIWRLSAPGSNLESDEIRGIEKDRLVYGNILDAYGTEVFGQNVSRSSESQRKLIRLARLNMLHTIGKITEQEKEEMFNLRKIFTTDDTTTF